MCERCFFFLLLLLSYLCRTEEGSSYNLERLRFSSAELAPCAADFTSPQGKAWMDVRLVACVVCLHVCSFCVSLKWCQYVTFFYKGTQTLRSWESTRNSYVILLTRVMHRLPPPPLIHAVPLMCEMIHGGEMGDVLDLVTEANVARPGCTAVTRVFSLSSYRSPPSYFWSAVVMQQKYY